MKNNLITPMKKKFSAPLQSSGEKKSININDKIR
jgi:hypothetical protein